VCLYLTTAQEVQVEIKVAGEEWRRRR